MLTFQDFGKFDSNKSQNFEINLDLSILEKKSLYLGVRFNESNYISDIVVLGDQDKSRLQQDSQQGFEYKLLDCQIASVNMNYLIVNKCLQISYIKFIDFSFNEIEFGNLGSGKENLIKESIKFEEKCVYQLTYQKQQGNLTYLGIHFKEYQEENGFYTMEQSEVSSSQDYKQKVVDLGVKSGQDISKINQDSAQKSTSSGEDCFEYKKKDSSQQVSQFQQNLKKEGQLEQTQFPQNQQQTQQQIQQQNQQQIQQQSQQQQQQGQVQNALVVQGSQELSLDAGREVSLGGGGGGKVLEELQIFQQQQDIESIEQSQQQYKNLENTVGKFERMLSKFPNAEKIEEEGRRVLVKNLKQRYHELAQKKKDLVYMYLNLKADFQNLDFYNERIISELTSSITAGMKPSVSQLNEVKSKFKQSQQDLEKMKKNLQTFSDETHALTKCKEFGELLDSLESFESQSGVLKEVGELQKEVISLQEQLIVLRKDCSRKAILRESKQVQLEQIKQVVQRLEEEVEILVQKKKKVLEQESSLEDAIANKRSVELNQAQISKEQLQQNLLDYRKKQQAFSEESDKLFEKQITEVQETLSQISDKQQHLHLILLLDCSGSMQNFWDELVKLVQKFLEQRAKISDDKVSIILFSSRAAQVFTNEAVKLVQKKMKLEPHFQGTNYFNAFNQAEIVLKFMSQGYKPLMIFFTDGGSEDPEQGYFPLLEKIKKNNQNLSFMGIGFGDLFTPDREEWKKLQRISIILNQTEETVLKIMGTKLQAIQSAENTHQLEKIFDELGNFSSLDFENTKKLIERIREQQNEDKKQREFKLKQEEQTILQQLEMQESIRNSKNKSNNTLYTELLEQSRKQVGEIENQIQNIQQSKKVKETEMESVRNEQRSLEQEEKELEQKFQEIQHSQITLQEALNKKSQSSDENANQFCKKWGFEYIQQYNEFYESINSGNTSTDVIEAIAQNSLQFKTDILFMENQFDTLFGRLEKLENINATEEFAIIQTYKDLAVIFSKTQNDDRHRIKALFQYLFSEDEEYNKLSKIFNSFMLDINLDKLMLIPDEPAKEKKKQLNNIINECFQGSTEPKVKTMQQHIKKKQNLQETLEKLKLKEELSSKEEQQIEKNEQEIEKLDEQVEKIKDEFTSEIYSILDNMHKVLHKRFKEQNLNSMMQTILSVRPISQKIHRITQKQQQLKLSNK